MKLLLRLSELVVVSSSMLKWDVYSKSSMSSLSAFCALKADVDEGLLVMLKWLLLELLHEADDGGELEMELGDRVFC